MALLFIEPFNRYAAKDDAGSDNDDGTTAWVIDGGITLDAGQGRFGAQVMSFNQNQRELRMRLGTISGSTLIFGGSMRWTNNASNIPAADYILRCATSGGSDNFIIRLGLGGTLYVVDATGATVGSAPFCIMNGVWHRIEVKCDMSDSGSLSIRIDGVQVLALTTTDFRVGGGSFDSLYLAGQHDSLSWEDVIVMDGSGSTFNDFQGDMRFEAAVVDADGATANWTASAGSKFQCIDDALAAYNDDTDYISSSTTDQVNMSSHANVSLTNATSVLFVCLMALARSDTTGDEIALQCTSSATTSTLGDLPLANTVYRWRKGFFEQNPSGPTAWTASSINAAEFGVKKRV